MQRLFYSTNVTLDGCIDHRAGIPDEALHHHAARNIANASAIVFGRVTYEMMESAWREPARTGVTPDWMDPWMLPFARTMDAAKKYVVSRTLRSVDWNAELLQGDLVASIRTLQAQPGNGLFVAGAQLAKALTELDLIDDYEFIIHARVVGHGPTLFGGLSKPLDLRLVAREELGSGSVAMRYERRR